MATLVYGMQIKKLEGGKNFHTWYIDVRALLRCEKLWIFANSSKDELEGTAAYHEYDEKVIDAADLITLHVSDFVKAQMPGEIFDDGYLMLEKFCEQYQPQRATQGEQTQRDDPQDTPLDKFSNLPPEIRNMIYKLVLCQQKYHLLKSYFGETSKEPTLLRTCKLMRREALGVFYGINVTVSIDLDQISKELSRCMRQLRGIIANCGLKPFKSFKIMLVHRNFWVHLKDFLPLLELIRATGFEPATNNYDYTDAEYTDLLHRWSTSRTSIFQMPADSMGNAQWVLEMALRLARRARAEGWDEARLALRFNKFVAEQIRQSQRGKYRTIIVEGEVL